LTATALVAAKPAAADSGTYASQYTVTLLGAQPCDPDYPFPQVSYAPHIERTGGLITAVMGPTNGECSTSLATALYQLNGSTATPSSLPAPPTGSYPTSMNDNGEMVAGNEIWDDGTLTAVQPASFSATTADGDAETFTASGPPSLADINDGGTAVGVQGGTISYSDLPNEPPVPYDVGVISSGASVSLSPGADEGFTGQVGRIITDGGLVADEYGNVWMGGGDAIQPGYAYLDHALGSISGAPGGAGGNVDPNAEITSDGAYLGVSGGSYVLGGSPILADADPSC
jgi:hypothetical protein